MDLAAEREPKDVPDEGNRVKAVMHRTNAQHECLGVVVHLWCPGCQGLHAPVMRCPEHGGPPDGPVWDGDPWSEPFTMSPSLLVHSGPPHPRCHSFILEGQWQFLTDSEHPLAGQTVPLEPLPNWIHRKTDWHPQS